MPFYADTRPEITLMLNATIAVLKINEIRPCSHAHSRGMLTIDTP